MLLSRAAKERLLSIKDDEGEWPRLRQPLSLYHIPQSLMTIKPCGSASVETNSVI